MEWLFYLLIPVVIYLVYLSVKAAAKAARERSAALAALAARRGWTFSPGETTSIAARFGAFGTFQQGHSRAWYNTLKGYLRIDGRQFDLLAGDYTYKVTTSTGKTRTTTTYEISYILVECPFPRVPDLLIRREGFMDRIGAVIGLADIDFESAEFSRAFYVKGPDRKFAFSLIHPQMIEFLMAGSPPPIELRGGRLHVGGDGSLWTPQEYDRQLEFVTGFLGLWPQYLQDDLEATT